MGRTSKNPIQTRHAAKRGVLLSKAPISEGTKALHDLIADVAPKATEQAHDQAVQELVDAISEYRRSYLYNVDRYRHQGSIKQDRKALANLKEALGNCFNAVDALHGSILALRLFEQHSQHGIGHLKKELSTWVDAAQSAYDEANKLPDRPVAGHDLGYLAYQVASTMQNTLGIKPTLTANTRHKEPGKRGGAGYRRLLQAAIELAGGKPAEDLLKPMRQGKAFLTAIEKGDSTLADF